MASCLQCRLPGRKYNELARLLHSVGFTRAEAWEVLLNAAAAAFLPPGEKAFVKRSGARSEDAWGSAVPGGSDPQGDRGQHESVPGRQGILLLWGEGCGGRGDGGSASQERGGPEEEVFSLFPERQRWRISFPIKPTRQWPAANSCRRQRNGSWRPKPPAASF